MPQTTKTPKVYYVNDVGDDFTFYLEFHDNKEQLLKDWVPQKDSKEQSYETSEKLQVIVLSGDKPTLSAKHIEKNGEEILNILNSASQLSNNNLKTLFENKFPPTLTNEIKNNLDDYLKNNKEQNLKNLLNQIAKKLNEVLLTKDLENELHVSPIILDPDEEDSITKLGFENGEKTIYRNRKLFDKEFSGVIKPLQITGRSLITLSYEGAFLSISFRKQSGVGYEPKPAGGLFPLGIKDYCDVLKKIFFGIGNGENFSKKTGLLVITGATNSAKSEIARGLIYEYLKAVDKTKRRPHLVTFEDPIEKLYADKPDEDTTNSNISVSMPATLEHEIDYTPRELGKDAGSLRQAFKDALRQTPTVFFVGETRDKEEWKEILDFASTGHLVVTTAHAGSLTEAMHKLFSALRIKTPAERSELANRLLGIVHLRPSRHNENIKIPAVWQQTPIGKNDLVAEGLSSMLPHNSNDKNDESEKGCLGRTYLVKKLISLMSKDKKSELETSLEKEAIKWDLEGV